MFNQPASMLLRAATDVCQWEIRLTLASGLLIFCTAFFDQIGEHFEAVVFDAAGALET